MFWGKNSKEALFYDVFLAQMLVCSAERKYLFSNKMLSVRHVLIFIDFRESCGIIRMIKISV